jgi:methyl-accepting chemotaxis protein
LFVSLGLFNRDYEGIGLVRNRKMNGLHRLSSEFSSKAVLAFGLGLLVMYFGGCGQNARTTFRGSSTPKTGQISKDQLRTRLDAFEEFFRASVKETADRVDELDPTPKARKISLILRVRTFQAINTMLQQGDPVVAFIETWGFVVRLHQYLEEGGGTLLYGDNQYLLVEMSSQIEARIETIGRAFMKEDVFEETRKHIYGFARSNPIKPSFSNTLVYATMSENGKGNPFASITRIPMAPIRAMEGVNRTAGSINNFTDAAVRFSDIVEELPESVRWQMLGLLYDFEETEMAQSFVASMSRFSESSERLAEATENLPEDSREQLSILVEEIDNRQVNLQATLDKTQKTLTAAEHVVSQIDKTAASFQATAVDVNRAAAAWDKAAGSTQETLIEFAKLKPTPKNPSAEPAFKIKDVQDIAETVNQTVGGLQSLTVKIGDLVELEQFASYASLPERFVNLLVWRLGQLIATVFVLTLAYRAASVRVMKKRGTRKDNRCKA